MPGHGRHTQSDSAGAEQVRNECKCGCTIDGVDIGAVGRIRQNRLRASAMPSCAKLLRVTLKTCCDLLLTADIKRGNG